MNDFLLAQFDKQYPWYLYELFERWCTERGWRSCRQVPIKKVLKLSEKIVTTSDILDQFTSHYALDRVISVDDQLDLFGYIDDHGVDWINDEDLKTV